MAGTRITFNFDPIKDLGLAEFKTGGNKILYQKDNLVFSQPDKKSKNIIYDFKETAQLLDDLKIDSPYINFPLFYDNEWHVHEKAGEKTLAEIDGTRMNPFMLAEVIAAVATLHKAGLVHRDLSADNVLIYGEHAKLSDLAKMRTKDTPDKTYTAKEGSKIPPEIKSEEIPKTADDKEYQAADKQKLECYRLGLILDQTLPKKDFQITALKDNYGEKLVDTLFDIKKRLLLEKPDDRMTAKAAYEQIKSYLPNVSIEEKKASSEKELICLGAFELNKLIKQTKQDPEKIFEKANALKKLIDASPDGKKNFKFLYKNINDLISKQPQKNKKEIFKTATSFISPTITTTGTQPLPNQKKNNDTYQIDFVYKQNKEDKGVLLSFTKRSEEPWQISWLLEGEQVTFPLARVDAVQLYEYKEPLKEEKRKLGNTLYQISKNFYQPHNAMLSEAKEVGERVKVIKNIKDQQFSKLAREKFSYAIELMRASPVFAVGIVGALICTFIFPVVGTAVGALIGSFLGWAMGEILYHSTLKKEANYIEHSFPPPQIKRQIKPEEKKEEEKKETALNVNTQINQLMGISSHSPHPEPKTPEEKTLSNAQSDISSTPSTPNPSSKYENK